MVAYLPADLSKKGLEFTTHSGEFSIVPNSPPEPRTIFIFKVFLKFLLSNMDYYRSADAVFIETVKVCVLLYCFTVPPELVEVTQSAYCHVGHKTTTTQPLNFGSAV
jgi:hypothetical protein